MILAAGRGERMRPLTDNLPKPLLHVHSKPLIVHHIEKLAKAGFREIVINIAHLGYKIAEALGDGSDFGVSITYSDEQDEGALESAGGIVKALGHLGEEFLVVNADVWCDYEFDANFQLFESEAHLIFVENPEHNVNGDFALENKMALNNGVYMYTFSGIGYYSAKLFKELAYGKRALAPILRDAIERKSVSAELYSGVWRDIGTPQRLDEVNGRW